MEHGMEPDVKKYLVRILNSMSVGMIWLILNATLGIYFQLGFFDHGLTVTNILFYCWLLLSIFLLLWYYYRTWK